MEIQEQNNAAAVLKGLIEVGNSLSVQPDRRKMLDMILAEARKLTSAEAGTLYVVQDDVLKFVAVQNDRLTSSQISELLLDSEIPIRNDSLAGFVASASQMLNIPDANNPPAGAPFRIRFEKATAADYDVRSILAIPLSCPNGDCVGVLQLINHSEPDGRKSAFPEDPPAGLMSLASMAAVSIHNSLLQEQLKHAQLDCIIRLSVAAELHDDDTAEHIRRVSHVSKIIAEALGLDSKEVELLRNASPMHDIGKIGIPDAILQKPGPLTPQERAIVREHPRIGADILSNPSNSLIATAHDVALTHHEHWDGEGYPNGLSGEEIPISGRIVSLVDVFDALISMRCYKKAICLDTSLGIIRTESGKQFDPAITNAFFKVLDSVLDFYREASLRAQETDRLQS